MGLVCFGYWNMVYNDLNRRNHSSWHPSTFIFSMIIFGAEFFAQSSLPAHPPAYRP